MKKEEIISNIEIQHKIKSIWENHINEGVSGRLQCTTAGKKKIAKLIGCNFDTMGKEKRKMFNSDLISGYQMGYFKKYHDY